MCAVLYGDLFLGITIPAAILVLPGVALLRITSAARPRSTLPAGLFLLGLTGVAVALQAILGYGPRGKTDLVVYLPFAYAALAMLVLSGTRVSDRHLHTSFVAGGLLSGVLLTGTLIYADAGYYAVPGQNPVLAQQREDDVRAVTRPQDGVAPPREPRVEHESTARRLYYQLKNRVRTPLGMSNYLAVIFVFLFNVMLYQRSWWAVAFAALVLVTLSRSGLAFLAISLVFWTAHTRGRLRPVILGFSVAAVAAWILALAFQDQLRAIPGMETVVARLWFQTIALAPIASHPLIGVPRSETLREFAYSMSWNPHNSILHLMLLFGLVGTIGYAAYMTVVFKAVFNRARDSRVWSGIAAGIAVVLLWSSLEIVVLTPAFELLMAGVYCVARADSSRERRSPNGPTES